MQTQKACPLCRFQAPARAAFCPQCGCLFDAPAPLPHAPEKHPVWIAVLLALVPGINGLGQLYNRQYEKALVLLFVLPCVWLAASYLGGWHAFATYSRYFDAILAGNAPAAAPLSLCVPLLLIPLAQIAVSALLAADAGLIAARLERGERVGDWQMF